MPEIIKGLTDRRLSELFDWLKDGELALPELQRPSVWSADKIPRLLESVYWDYPFGMMLLWSPAEGERIVSRRFKFESVDKVEDLFASHYLIDGQQRLTSFYRSLHPDGNTPQDWSVDVAFNVLYEEFALVDGKIKVMLPNPKAHGWYRLRKLLATSSDELAEVRREQNQKDLPDKTFDEIFTANGRLSRLRPENISVAIYNVRDRSYSDVVEIFERINEGTPVKKSQIILGRLSAFEQGIVGNVEGYLASNRARHGRSFDLDLYMRTLAVLARGSAQLDPLANDYEWRNEYDSRKIKSAIRTDVDRTKAAIDRAFAFMDVKLHLDTMKYIRASRTISCLAFLLEKFESCRCDGIDADKTAWWIAQVILSGLHESEVRFKTDLTSIAESDIPPFDEFRKHLRRESIESQIGQAYKQLENMDYPVTRGDTIFTFLYAMARRNGAVSFPSGRPICAEHVEDASDDEAGGNRSMTMRSTLHEHHIYPSAILQAEAETENHDWLDRSWISDIGNITFILGDDNFGIGNSPIGYLDRVREDVKTQHMIPLRQYRTGQYEVFFKDRREFIKSSLQSYFESLKLVGFLVSSASISKDA